MSYVIPYIFAKTSVSCPKSFYCSSSVHLLKIFYNENQSLCVSDEEQSDIHYWLAELSFISMTLFLGRKKISCNQRKSGKEVRYAKTLMIEFLNLGKVLCERTKLNFT